MTQLKVTTRLEQLLHFRSGPIWDGNCVSKAARDTLHDQGYIERAGGFQFLTSKGITLLIGLGYLNENTWREYLEPKPNAAHLCNEPLSISPKAGEE